MDLEAFVKESLLQVIRGMVSAQAEAKEMNTQIMPIWGTNHHQRHREKEIEFDVAVTATESSGKSGHGGVKVMGVGVGGEGQRERSHETASRLKFTIPVAFPTYRNLES